jgi:hypothetical protein
MSGAWAGRNDIGTQTPLGSPEERTILNGLIATDYGFSHCMNLSNISDTTAVQQAVDTEPIAPQRNTQSFVLRMPPKRSPENMIQRAVSILIFSSPPLGFGIFNHSLPWIV